jgi:hypothetical protein
MSDHEANTKLDLDEDNVFAVMKVIKASLFSLPETYVYGFTDYIDKSANPLNDLGEYNVFWQLLILSYVRNSSESLEEIHNSWVDRVSNTIGWTFGVQFDAVRRTCPLLISFSSLSFVEESMVRLFSGIAWALLIEADDE